MLQRIRWRYFLMTNNNFSQVAAFIWSVADLLRGDFKQSQYGRVILPFTLLRRLECVLEKSKADVLAAHEKIKVMPLPEEAKEKMLLKATGGLSFFNTSELSLENLGQKDIRANLSSYIQNFSADAREIFEHFKFEEFIGLLDDANLLYKVVQYFSDPKIDLSPANISNHEMGLVFEELIRRFAEGSNETAGEHFTPRDIVRLTTGLIFGEDDDALNKDGIIRTVYDPTAGTGGFLSSGAEYVREHNPDAVIRVYGQELNPESYAICKADMLIKGQDVKISNWAIRCRMTNWRMKSLIICCQTRRLVWIGKRLKVRLKTSTNKKVLKAVLVQACHVCRMGLYCS